MKLQAQTVKGAAISKATLKQKLKSAGLNQQTADSLVVLKKQSAITELPFIGNSAQRKKVSFDYGYAVENHESMKSIGSESQFDSSSPHLPKIIRQQSSYDDNTPSVPRNFKNYAEFGTLRGVSKTMAP